MTSFRVKKQAKPRSNALRGFLFRKIPVGIGNGGDEERRK